MKGSSIIHSSNGLILFSSPDEMESYLKKVFEYRPFPGKEEKMISLSKKSFEVLDLICEMLVPPKDLGVEKKRSSVNKFLSTKVNDKISERNNEAHDEQIESLKDLIDSLQRIDENHSLILRGLASITESSTVSSLRGEILSKMGTQIKSFEAVLIELIDQAGKDQKDIRKIKDSIDAIVESNIVKDKKITKTLLDISSGLIMRLRSLARLTDEIEEHKKTIKDFCDLQVQHNKNY